MYVVLIIFYFQKLNEITLKSEVFIRHNSDQN